MDNNICMCFNYVQFSSVLAFHNNVECLLAKKLQGFAVVTIFMT